MESLSEATTLSFLRFLLFSSLFFSLLLFSSLSLSLSLCGIVIWVSQITQGASLTFGGQARGNACGARAAELDCRHWLSNASLFSAREVLLGTQKSF
jgi:hypothetical protein